MRLALSKLCLRDDLLLRFQGRISLLGRARTELEVTVANQIKPILAPGERGHAEQGVFQALSLVVALEVTSPSEYDLGVKHRGESSCPHVRQGSAGAEGHVSLALVRHSEVVFGRLRARVCVA